jgi:hypothetical protein
VTLLQDVQHNYWGHWQSGAVCRIRIYEGTAAADHLPVVIVTELPYNHNTSTTNRIQYIAADVLMRYLARQDGLSLPFQLLNHYPDDCPEWRHRIGRHDSIGVERWTLVSFSRWTPVRATEFGPREVWRLPGTGFQRIDQRQVEAMIGQPWTYEYAAAYPEPARA